MIRVVPTTGLHEDQEGSRNNSWEEAGLGQRRRQGADQGRGQGAGQGRRQGADHSQELQMQDWGQDGDKTTFVMFNFLKLRRC